MILAILFLLIPFGIAQSGENAPTTDLYKSINPETITTLKITKPVGEIVEPPPAVHRIGSDIGESNLSGIQTLQARRSIQRGIQWLLSHQDPGGGWGGGTSATPTNDPEAPQTPTAAAITGLGLMALAQSGFVDRDQLDPAIQRLRMARRKDFGIDDGPLSNYVLAAVTSGLASLEDPAFDELVADGVIALRSNQWDANEGLTMTQDWYGGAGYGNRGRPDLSNTQMMLDTLYDAGIGPDDVAFQRAVVFLTRCQNLNSTNSAPWATDDGGFVYTPANGGESLASEVAGHGRRGDENLAAGQPVRLRSYGSMTYAGFKSLLYAGLGPDDPRVHAALQWLSKHWTLDENPGLGQQGYFYYLYTMARALRASRKDVITGSDGTQHVWRAEMLDAILSRQHTDGSWINKEDRWLEGHRDLATIYSLLALEEILKPREMNTEQISQ